MTQFDFLGYTFRRRSVRNARDQRNFVGFTPAVSNASKKAMNKYLRDQQMHRHIQADIEEIARSYNPVLSGWLEYYGRYSRSELETVFTSFNKKLIQWLMRKYKRFRGHKTRAGKYLEKWRLEIWEALQS
ncbi:MAG: group II intron maturase-specific domain-containing protein [Myxococcota bacterium]